jgi:nicotinamidase-related amidase
MDRTALIVVDVQTGFDDAGFWGPRNNTACEENASALIAARRANDQPIVFVRHYWDEDGSPLRSDEAGSEFKDVIEGHPRQPKRDRPKPRLPSGPHRHHGRRPRP